MFLKLSQNGVYRLALGALVLGLAGCPPQNESQPPPPTVVINPVSLKLAACEAKLRKQMQEKSIHFVSIPELRSEIEVGERSAATADSVRYRLTLGKQLSSLSMTHVKLTESTFNGLSYELGLSDSTSSFPFYFNIKTEQSDARSFSKLTQQMNVDDTCSLSLASTSFEKSVNESGKTWKYTQFSYYIDGKNQSKSATYDVPDDLPFLSVIAQLNDDQFQAMPPKGYVFFNEIGLVTTDYSAGDLSIKEFGIDFHFKGGELSIVSNGKSFLKLFLGEDKSNDATIVRSSKYRNFRVPKAVFEAQSLGASRDVNASVVSEVSLDQLRTSNSLKLVTSTEPSYDHFKAYWNITSHTKDAASGVHTLILQENPDPTVNDGTSPADLASNSTIQTELPEIQAIARDIRGKAGDSRKTQIEMILQYLAEHYTYDKAMVEKNIVRPLTTKEALQDGKGVCQHYAVIFTAIARALQIPTRIVAGYHLSDKLATSHAWVETEIEAGRWRVIEPQNPKTLSTMYTRFYFPSLRATHLEDKESNWADVIAYFASLNMTFKPL